jgi:hypothetical protein
MRKYVMIDCETLSRRPNAVVLSIGAVIYTLALGIYERIELFPDLDEQFQSGRDVEGETFLWWLKQSSHARDSIVQGHRVSVKESAIQFNHWKTACIDDSPPRDTFYMANGNDFDLPIISTLFSPYLTPPWEGYPGFRQKLCWRTHHNLFQKDITYQDGKTAHTALADAEAQALAHLSLLRKRPELDSGLS